MNCNQKIDYIEKIFYNIDILNIIIINLALSDRIFIYKICKFFYKNIERINCDKCLNKICCPILVNNFIIDKKIMCYGCVNKDIKYNITKNDIIFWNECEKIEKKNVKCEFCKIKCSNLQTLHYHINFKCIKYNPLNIYNHKYNTAINL